MKATISDKINHVLTLEANALLACAERFTKNEQKQALERAIELMQKSLNQGGKIIVTGVGKSGKVGQKIAATFSSTGSFSIFLHPTEGLHGDLGILKKEDCVLALSFSGNTMEVLNLVPSIRELGCQVIALAGKSESKLAQQCDVWIDASVPQEACPHNLAPTSSTTLALAIGDAFAVTLMELRGFNADQFALNHPGGSLGKRMTLTVKSIMHRKNLPFIDPGTPMNEVVTVATETRLGGVMVTQKGQLIGLITDGDIRKALSHQEAFFSLKANDVMTPNPMTIQETQLAHEALKLMESGKSQISVLPVLNASKEVTGFLRIHDIVQEL